jgi:CheY-like chemotaxis protein
MLVHVTGRTLERLGYRCTGHTDARSALAAFREAPHAFAAVITDYAMPGMSGLELARALRAVRPDIPIALASGNAPREAWEASEVAVRIMKPSGMADLARAVARLLDGSGARPLDDGA